MAIGMIEGLGHIRDAGMFAIAGRHESGATAALLRYCERGVEIVLGNPANNMIGIRRIAREVVTFEDAPELRNLWGLTGWRMSEVDALLNAGADHVLAAAPRIANSPVTLVNESPA